MQFLDRFTGKTSEDKIAGYLEIYGEVLVGIHGDLEDFQRRLQAQGEKVAECQRRLQALAEQIECLQPEVQAQQMKRLHRLCAFSYIFALSVGIAVWLIR